MWIGENEAAPGDHQSQGSSRMFPRCLLHGARQRIAFHDA